MDPKEMDRLVGSGVDYNNIDETRVLVNFHGTLKDLRVQLLDHYRSLGIDQDTNPVKKAEHFCVMHHGCRPGSAGHECECITKICKPPQVRVLGSNFELHADGELHEVSDTVNDRTSTLLELGLVPGHKVQVFYVPPNVIEVLP